MLQDPAEVAETFVSNASARDPPEAPLLKGRTSTHMAAVLSDLGIS